MADPLDHVSAWLLAGGEGRRMGGRDKGLVLHQGRPLAEWVARHMSAQAHSVNIIANRHQTEYESILDRATTAGPALRGRVLPDDADLPPQSGPMAGVLTALRHADTPWLWLNPCDTPALPDKLLPALAQVARQQQLDAVVAATSENPSEWRQHWLCCLISKRVCPHTEAAFVKGERKIGQWMQSLRWQAVCFPEAQAFMNINTPETTHGRD